MVAILSIIRTGPKIIAIIYAIVLILSSASVSLREGDARPFLIDGIGTVVTGADSQMSASLDQMILKKQASEADFILFFDVLGSITLLYFVLSIFHTGVLKLLGQKEFLSPFAVWLLCFLIVGLVQTTFYAVQQGQLMLGYSGLFKLILNADSFFYPIHGWVVGLGQASVVSPIF